MKYRGSKTTTLVPIVVGNKKEEWAAMHCNYTRSTFNNFT